MRLLESDNTMLVESALRAVAMLRMRPGADAVGRIVRYAARLGPNDGRRFWVAAAAGWDAPEVADCLRACAAGPREDVR